MAALVAFVYIVCTIVYLAIGDAERTWGGFNHITLLLMIAGMIYFPKPLSALQKDFVDLAQGFDRRRNYSLSNSLIIIIVPEIKGVFNPALSLEKQNNYHKYII